jgi:hypothetical protein
MNSALLPALGIAVKLGRKVPQNPRPALRLKSFLPATPPTPPVAWDGRPPGVRWPMYGNDRYGDCVFASLGHQIGLWTLAESGKETLFTDSEVLQWYSDVTGFNPRRPWTDQGAVIQDALDAWVTKGFSKHMLAGYLQVGSESIDRCKIAADEFGGLKLGVALPAAWQGRTGPAQTWDVGPNAGGVWAPGSWGGHDVPVVAYDEHGVTVITWGREQPMTWAALQRYCDEVWAPVSWEWCVDDTTPSGIRKQQLIDTFSALGGGPLAPPPVPPAPDPPPSPPSPPSPPGSGDRVEIVVGGERYTTPATWTPAASAVGDSPTPAKGE